MEDYFAFRHYIHHNPVKRGLVPTAEQYVHSSARPGFVMDEAPQRLKPVNLTA